MVRNNEVQNELGIDITESIEVIETAWLLKQNVQSKMAQENMEIAIHNIKKKEYTSNDMKQGYRNRFRALCDRK